MVENLFLFYGWEFLSFFYLFLIHSFVIEHLSCFLILPIINSEVMNIEVHVSFQISVFVFSGYVCTQEWIAGPYGNSIFSFLRNLHTAFHSGYINLHTHQQDIRVPFSPHSCKHLLYLNILYDCHSDRCEVISIVVLFTFLWWVWMLSIFSRAC